LYVQRAEMPPGLDGKRNQRTVYGKSEAEVRRKIADLTAQGGGTLQPANPTTLSEYSAVYVERMKKTRAENSVEHYLWA